jgi:acyl carrier protein
MAEQPLPRTLSRQQFALELVRFINEILPQVHSRLTTNLNIDGSTPLFETGLIDSLAIIHLIAFVEKTTGQPIPARMVVMKHFRTVDAICDAFCQTAESAP